MFQVRRSSVQRSQGTRLARFEALEGRRLMSVAVEQALYQAPVYAANQTAELSRPSVTGSDPAANKTNVRRDAFVAAYVNLPNVGHGVSEAALRNGVVKLYKSSDLGGNPIPANVNTTGGGDAIILTPAGLLDANTKYTFEVTTGLTDTSGAVFLPFTMTFTTGADGGTIDTSVGFDKVPLPTATNKRFTGVTVGPDNRLYAGTLAGEIFRYDIKSDGTLSSGTLINTVRNGNGGKNRILTGLRFDPSSTAGNLILWVTHGDGIEEGAPDWTGKLSRLTGSNLQTYQDYVTGLPRSVRDHLTNQIDFDPQNRLYISQGSMNAMGAPDNAWGQRAERLLSAAILRVDTAAIAARIAQGQGALNVKTEAGGSYSPFASGAPVTIYATGVRNAYDLLWHSNGNLYAPSNGSAPGGNTPSGGGAPGLKNVAQNEDDWLFKIRKDKYYGHPNPTRGEYVLNGGNPTSGKDKYEVAAYPVGTKPDKDWDPAVYSFGANRSPNGIIEYKSSTFGGSLRGSMLVVRYSGGDDVLILKPDASGNIPSSGVKSGVTGLTGFVDPLDIAEQVGPGNLYVVEHGADRITLLRPRGSSGSAVSTPVRNPKTLYFNDPVGGPASAARRLSIKNPGGSSFNITEISISGADASMFRIVSKPTLPKSLSGGATTDVTVEFNPPAGTALGLRKATLVVKTSSSSTPILQYDLRALATLGLTGANEPSLQRIFDLFQLPINAGDANPSTSDMPLPLAGGNNAVNLQKLVKAGSGPVTIEPLDVFASSGTPTIKFGYYTSSGTTQVATFTDAQSVNPGLTSGSYSFDPGSGAFGLYTNAPAFGSRLTYSEDAKNTWEPVAANRKKMLLFPLKDKNGATVPDAYVMAWEEVEGSYDFQDFVAVIRNVRDPNAAPTQPPPVSGNGSLNALSLVNADTDQSVGTLNDNASFSYAGLGVTKLTVRADTAGTIGSVRWGLDGNSNYRTENFAPYAIGGDQNSTDLLPINLSVGTHTITATAYSGANGSGAVLGTITRTFTITGSGQQGTSAGIVGITLMNAENGSAIGQLRSETLDLKNFPTKKFTLRADTIGKIGSVKMEFGNTVKVENFAPYTLAGEDSRGKALPFAGFKPGTYVVRMTAYSGRNATGSVVDVPFTITLKIVDTSLPQNVPGPGVVGLTIYNADTNQPMLPLANGNTLDLNTLPTRNITLRAETVGTFGSVRFDFDGVPKVRLENYAPYFIAGENGNDYLPFAALTPGLHNIAIAAYEGQNGGGGLVGLPLVLSFTLVG